MILIAIAICALLANGSARLAHSLFYPPAIFAAFWAGLMTLLFLSGNHFYPLLDGSLAVFVVGALSYSFGGRFGFAIPQQPYTPLSRRHREFLSLIFTVASVAIAVFSVLYFGRLSSIVENSGVTSNSFTAIRYELCYSDDETMSLGLYKYAVSLFEFLTIAAWIECDGSAWQRRRCWFMAAFILAFHLATAGRCGAIMFVFALLWIVLFRKKRIAVAPLVFGAVVLAAVFALAAILLEKGGHSDAGVLENVAGVFDSFLLYLLGGSVAFNEVVANPSFIQQDIFAFFHNLANALGADYDVCRMEPTFVQVPDLTNVYTLYMSIYAQFGFIGVVLYMFSLGGIAAWLFRYARNGASWAVAISSRLVGVLLFSGATDGFLPALSVWIQIGVYCWLFYALPRYWLDARSHLERQRTASLGCDYAVARTL